MTVEDLSGGAGDMPAALSMGGALEEFKEVEEVKKLIADIVNIYKDEIAVELTVERMQCIFASYQEQTHLLDRYLEDLLKQLLEIVRNPDVPSRVLHLAFKLLYLITKTRGYKVIVRMMPHETSDLEPVLSLLALQKSTDHEHWETRYVLLLWLSIVCMIPFDMTRFDGHVKTDTGDGRKTVTQRIIDTGMQYLCVCDKSRDAAAYMLSKFLTRPDVKKQKLAEFFNWALLAMKTADVSTMPGTIQLVGVLTTMALLFKHGKREDLVDYANTVLEHVVVLKASVTQNTVLAKLSMKLIQRLGLTFLKAKVANWRYQRGHRSLAANLALTAPGGDAEGPSPSVGSKEGEEVVEVEEEDYDIPEEVEEVIEQLLSGLKDKDTVVRWSAAKGIGRLTGRLPQELADEVVGSIMQLFTIVETDAAWHGGCLAMAELGRRGLLLPARLGDVVPVIIKALNFDEKRGNFSVGAHVRDAACYVCWSFARAYDPDQLKPFVNDIASALVIVSIFDREVNVRRAAAAAFQENVGRQGQFPHGIDILTTCDYFAVGNRTHCYTDLSVYVAQFVDYTTVLIDHLAHVKISHWDRNIRELCAEGLHCLTARAPQYMTSEVLPWLVSKCLDMDLTMRHGAILATSAVTHALALQAWSQHKEIADLVDKDTVENIRNVIPKLHEARWFRGLGGELMKKATCCMIHKLSLAKMPFHDEPIIDIWQRLLDDCLQIIDPDIQESATVALSAFLSEYYRQADGHPKSQEQEHLMAKYLEGLTSKTQTTRIGFALAFGAMPKFMLEGRVQEVMSSLVEASRLTEKEEKWVESRRSAVKALTSLYRTEPADLSSCMADLLSATSVHTIYAALFDAMNDYTLDSRGDVGAGGSEASMTGLLQVTSTLTIAEPSLITPEISRQLFCCIVQQSVEKIDRTRAHAGQVFSQLLYHSPEIPHIPHRDDLLEIFPQSVLDSVIWIAPLSTFPLFTQLLALSTYSYSVLLGLTVSVGGLTESLVKYSAAALLDYLRHLASDREATQVFSDIVLQIFRDHQKVDRVTLPMLKMLDQLLANGCFDVFVNDDHSFPQELLALSREEIRKCGEPQKLLASINVFCGLLQFPGKVRTNTLSQLFLLLCHKYPLVSTPSL
ncbi:hypothetical protein NP493_921g01087 [Ridgeia piscesae]|uniref:Tubulin-specific chaperone D n=1 Tax=Ridgeia piscesae TaxID=27915 RepID=A0AAD9NLF3_RIDPI|nr:hypothetical protein NP493_921g01087 [Ridgeia piscesae]